MSAAIKNWYSCGLIEKLLLASENYRKEIKILPASRELPPSVHLARVPIYPRVYFPEIFCVHGCDSSRKIGNKALYRWSATWSNPIRVSFFFLCVACACGHCCLRTLFSLSERGWYLLFEFRIAIFQRMQENYACSLTLLPTWGVNNCAHVSQKVFPY